MLVHDVGVSCILDILGLGVSCILSILGIVSLIVLWLLVALVAGDMLVSVMVFGFGWYPD